MDTTSAELVQAWNVSPRRLFHRTASSDRQVRETDGKVSPNRTVLFLKTSAANLLRQHRPDIFHSLL